MISTELGGYKISISDNVQGILNTFVQKSWRQHEAGGILLGEVSGKHIIIAKASVPSAFDKQRIMGFERNHVTAQLLIDYEYYNTNGRIIYLGEWHTHAELSPEPSRQDIRMMAEQFFNNKLNVPLMIVLIKGTVQSFIGLFDGKKLFYDQVFV